MPPPPPPLAGESAQAFVERRAALDAQRAKQALEDRKSQQIGWFDAASEVFVAQVVESRRGITDGTKLPEVMLKPVSWLKGKGPAAPFRVAFMGWSSCGPYGGGEAPTGRLGSAFVIFNVAGKPRGEVNIAVASVLDPRLAELLKQAQ